MSARRGILCLALGLAATPLQAQGTPTLLQRLAVLDSKKVDAVERGEAISMTLDAPEKTEITTLGVVRLDVPRAFYVARVRELTRFLATGSRAVAGSFSEPARLADVETLALDPSDAKALAKCQPRRCDVKLSAVEMELFHAQPGNAHARPPAADSLMREWLVRYVNAYRSDSTEETVVYDDTKRPVRSSDALRTLLAEPLPAGLDAEPFAAMLRSSRGARAATVASRISWELDRVPGLKPTLEVFERSTYSSPAHSEANWMTSKLLYASHYFEAQIDFITIADAPAQVGGSAAYLVVLRRSKFDDLPSGGLFNIRGKAVKHLRDALRTTLANTRDELSRAYGDSMGTVLPEH